MRILQYATRSAVTAAAFGLVLLSACSDSSGPETPFDPAGTSADVAAASEAFASPMAQSYAALGPEINAVAGGAWSAAVAAAPSAATFANRSSAIRYAQRVAQLSIRSSTRPSLSPEAQASAPSAARSSLRPSFSAAAMSAEQLGTTFVWDAAAGHYVESELNGAPANGVRFRLYAIDPVTGKPAEPLNDIGYVEITFAGTSTSASVRAKVVSGAFTYLDYAVTISGTANSETIAITGYATNGTDRAEFDLDTTLSADGSGELTLILDYRLDVPTRGFTIEMKISIADPFSTSFTLALDLEARGEHGRVSLSGSETDAGGSYTIEVNGDLFATITVDGEGMATLAGAGGQTLTQDEVAALQAIFGIFTDGFGFFESLLAPVF